MPTFTTTLFLWSLNTPVDEELLEVAVAMLQTMRMKTTTRRKETVDTVADGQHNISQEMQQISSHKSEKTCLGERSTNIQSRMLADNITGACRVVQTYSNHEETGVMLTRKDMCRPSNVLKGPWVLGVVSNGKRTTM